MLVLLCKESVLFAEILIRIFLGKYIKGLYIILYTWKNQCYKVTNMSGLNKDIIDEIVRNEFRKLGLKNYSAKICSHCGDLENEHNEFAEPGLCLRCFHVIRDKWLFDDKNLYLSGEVCDDINCVHRRANIKYYKCSNCNDSYLWMHMGQFGNKPLCKYCKKLKRDIVKDLNEMQLVNLNLEDELCKAKRRNTTILNQQNKLTVLINEYKKRAVDAQNAIKDQRHIYDETKNKVKIQDRAIDKLTAENEALKAELKELRRSAKNARKRERKKQAKNNADPPVYMDEPPSYSDGEPLSE